MAEEFDMLAAGPFLTGQIRLNEALPNGALVRLQLRRAGENVLLGEGQIGLNGLFRLPYEEPGTADAIVVEVVDPAGNLLAEPAELAAAGRARPQLFTSEGLRPLGDGEGFDIPATLPYPEVYWRAAYHMPAEQLSRSQDALQRLRTNYEADDRGIRDGAPPAAYPWRLQVNPTTGLPTVIRARLTSALLPQAEAEAVQKVVSGKDFSEAIFGVDLSGSFDKNFRAQPTIRLEGGGDGARGLEQNSHLSWRQIYQSQDNKEYPVLGGGFRLHGRTSITDVAITNSYYPLKEEDLDLRVTLHDEEILDRAMAALLSLPEIQGKASLVSEVLGRIDQRRGSLAFLRRLRPLLRWLGLAQAAHAPVRVDRESYYISDEDGEKAYALAIIPYAGVYHLAARVRLTLDKQAIWYVDVDVHAGLIVGRPWQAVSHAGFYATSQDAADGPPPLADFPANPFGFAAEPSPPLFILPPLADVNAEERATIAVHGQRLHNYLRTTCGAAQQLDAHLQTGHRIRVVLDAGARTQFNYDRSLPSKEIQFQQSSDVGIRLDAPSGTLHIFHPARDPEVILHEMTHAFFWLINPEPWEEQDVVSPFGRALHEGYAIYLARSVAAGKDANEGDKPWARGTYRTEWGDRWRLARSQREVGADFLRMPNQYPAHSFVQGFHNIQMEDYDIGMIWARALWDLRQVLGPEETDFLAVQAYPYLHGSIVNFETAAQGLIEADDRNRRFNAAAAVESIFSTRGLVSSEGTFGFTQTASGGLVAASDLGIQVRSGGGWVKDTTPGIDSIAGVASLTGEGNRLYAVAVPPRPAQMKDLPEWRTGLYRRENNQWSQLPTPGLTILGVYSLSTANGTRLFLTTTQGVYWLENGTPQRLGDDSSQLPAHDLLVWNQPDGSPRLLVAARSSSVAVIEVDNLPASNPTGIAWAFLSVGNDLRIAALAVREKGAIGSVIQEELYVGTLGGGIWCYGADDEFQQTHLTNRADAAVLAFTSSGARLVWSTAEEVGWSDDGQNVRRLPPPCPAALVISLHLQADGTLFVGTFAHGIWRVNLNGPAPVWQADRLPTAQGPQEIPPQKRRLIGYYHPQASPHAQLIVQGGVSVVQIAQPGFPLTLRSPDVNQRYAIEMGWLILMVNNPTGNLLKVGAQMDGNGNVSVTATV